MTQDSVNTSGAANTPDPGPTWQRHFSTVAQAELTSWWDGAKAGTCLTLIACAFAFIIWNAYTGA